MNWDPTKKYNVGDKILIPTKAKDAISGPHRLLPATVIAISKTTVTFDCPAAWKQQIVMGNANHANIDVKAVKGLVEKLGGMI